jgi:uroporphyrinogen decarboxylase
MHNPIRTASDVEAVKTPDPRQSVAFTIEAVSIVRKMLEGKIPLIGFSGAPFTLASYAIEGGSSRDYRRTKGMMYNDPASWKTLMEKLVYTVSEYLLGQIEVGAQAVQIFDSWAGALSPFDYREYVLPYVQECVANVKEKSDVPVIYFGTDMNGMLPVLRESGADVLGADWRINLDEAWEQMGHDKGIQGNLDPTTLFAPWHEVERRAADILQRAGGRPGHIFNLGHGILTETPVENVAKLVDFVHSYRPA